MGTLGNLELPAQLSPCLRLFIEKLFAEVGDSRYAWVCEGRVSGSVRFLNISEGQGLEVANSSSRRSYVARNPLLSSIPTSTPGKLR
jgi:hypothetical protein